MPHTDPDLRFRLSEAEALSRRYRMFLIVIISLGVCFRLYHFLDNRSLWEDELFLASSLIRMDFRELATLPLDYHQRAPLGYLWAVRLCVALFGSHEMPLRLFSLCCGIVSLFAFVPVARHFLRPPAALLALAMLAVAPPLVYHAVEAKQYGPELMVSILCLGLYVRFHYRTDYRSALLWGLAGALLLWFSFTALFVLAGIVSGHGLYLLLQRRWKPVFRLLVPVFIWSVSFGLIYRLTISRYADDGWLQDFWMRRHAFFPLPPAFGAELKWIVHWLYSFVYYPLGLTWVELDYARAYTDLQRVLARMPLLPLGLLLGGAVALFRERKRLLYVLAAVVLVSVAASSLKFYPLHERLNTFLAPVGILLIAVAWERIYTWDVGGWKLKYGVAALLLAPALINSLVQAGDTARFGGYKKSYQREMWQYLERRYRKGDLVYVYWNDLPGWNYYSRAYDLQMDVREGRDLRAETRGFGDYFGRLSASDFADFGTRPRVWVVYRNFNGMKTGDREGQPAWYYRVDAVKQLHQYLLGYGRETQVFRPANGAVSDIHAGLFQFREVKP